MRGRGLYCAGSDDISDLLVENGADINAQMNSGLTPLMIACQCVSTLNGLSTYWIAIKGLGVAFRL